MDNETWLVETGAKVIEKLSSSGECSLNTWEKLVYCFWVADYSMRNAGDLDTARDLYEHFLSDGKKAAKDLKFPTFYRAFSLRQYDLEQKYFDLFDNLCAEIRAR